jgi:predicted type IV restriction endonuclease
MFLCLATKPMGQIVTTGVCWIYTDLNRKGNLLKEQLETGVRTFLRISQDMSRRHADILDNIRNQSDLSL